MQGMKAREIQEELRRETSKTLKGSFDLDKVLDFENVHEQKKKLILEEFINFFFTMIKDSRKFRATGQVQKPFFTIKHQS
jgi:hypothetical protein